MSFSDTTILWYKTGVVRQQRTKIIKIKKTNVKKKNSVKYTDCVSMNNGGLQ